MRSVPAALLVLALLPAACHDTRPAEGPARADARVAAPGPDAAAPLRVAGQVPARARVQVLEVSGSALVEAGDHVDLLGTLERPDHQGRATVAVALNLVALARLPRDRLVLLVLPEEAELVALARRLGPIWVARRHPADPDVEGRSTQVTWTSLLTPQRLVEARASRPAAIRPGTGAAPGGPPVGAREVLVPLPVAEVVGPGDRVDVLATIPEPVTGDRITLTVLEDAAVSRTRGGEVALVLAPTEVAHLVHAAAIGHLDATVRRPGDASRVEARRRMTRAVVLTGERATVGPTLDATGAARRRIEVIRSLPTSP